MKRGSPLRRTGPIRSRPKPKRPPTMVPKNLGESARGYKEIGRDRDHMGRVAALGCIICQSPAQAHHCDTVIPKGMGPKVSDYLTLPLCPDHHTDKKYNCAHGYGGEREFWKRNKIDEGRVILSILREWYPDPDEHVAAAIAAIEKQRGIDR